MRSSRRWKKNNQKSFFSFFCCLIESDLWPAHISQLRWNLVLLVLAFCRSPFSIYHMLIYGIRYLVNLNAFILAFHWFGIAFGEHWKFCIWPMPKAHRQYIYCYCWMFNIEHFLLRESFHDPHHMYPSTMHEHRKNFKCSFVSKPSRLIVNICRPSFYSLVSGLLARSTFILWKITQMVLFYSNCKLKIQLPVC